MLLNHAIGGLRNAGFISARSMPQLVLPGTFVVNSNPQITQVRHNYGNLKPNNFKHKKAFKGRVSLLPVQSDIDFGEYGLRVLESSRITAAQMDAMKQVILRRLRPLKGQMWMRIFPDVPVSEKPAEVRMGKGKGSVEYWCARVRKNKIIFEVGGVPVEAAEDALQQASFKIGLATRFEVRKKTDYDTILARPMPEPLVNRPKHIDISI
eukprot:CFRG0035T1